MADDVVLARFRLDLEQIKKDAQDYLATLDKIQDETAQTGKAGKTASDQLAAQGKKRSAAIKGEADQLKKVGAASREAFNTKPVDNFTKEVNKSQAAIKRVGSEGNSVGRSLKGAFALVGPTILAAFSIDAIKQFATASINAFLAAEQNAEKLKFAITQIGGEGEAAFQRLIDQSERLQKTTVFSDDSVQQAQTILSTFGLTADQIEELIPKLADFATVTKQDITQAAQSVGQGLQGMGREFKKFGIDVNATQTELENYNTILKGFTEQQGAAAKETETLAGQLQVLQNRSDELQESIGEKLAPAWVKLKTSIFEATLVVIDFFKAGEAGVARGLASQGIDKLPTAYEKITARVESLTAELVKRGLSEREASALAIQSIQEEINANIRMRIEKLKLANASEDINLAEVQMAQNRLRGARNELDAILAIFEAKQKQGQLDQRILTVDGLRKRSAEELNALLKENLAVNDIIGQSNVKLINREIEARKKALEELKKLQEKERQELEKNIDLLAKLRVEGIDEEKQRRIAVYEDEIRTLTAQGQLRGAIMLEMENKLVNDLNEIDKKRNVDPLFRATPSAPAIPDQLPTATPNSADETLARLEDERAERLRFNDEIIAGTAQLISQLNSLWGSYANAQIDRINRETDAQMNALNAQEEAIDKQLKNRSISEREAEIKKEQLLRAQVEAEEKAAKKIREVKRKQAIMDKAAALIQITINTAEAVSKAAAQSGVLAPAFAALMAALGAAQAAIVVAQPIPYKRGSKNTRAGLSVVGEEGPEYMMMPQGAQVVPNRQTTKNRKLIDAMIDDDLDSFIRQNYVVPELMRLKRASQQRAGEDFATNITKSIQYNNLADPRIGQALSKAGYIRNADEIGQAIARHLPKTDRYRR